MRLVASRSSSTTKVLQEVIREAFTVEGYEVEVVSNGTAGLEFIRQKTHSGLIVNLQLPGLSTWDLCRQLMQAAPATLFVVLSASPTTVDKVFFLEMGADDYIAVPFSPKELVARLHALRRRMFQFTAEGLCIFGNVMVDLMKMEVIRDHIEIKLTIKEFRTLEFMIKNAGRAISRDELLNEVWGYKDYPCSLFATGEAKKTLPPALHFFSKAPRRCLGRAHIRARLR